MARARQKRYYTNKNITNVTYVLPAEPVKEPALEAVPVVEETPRSRMTTAKTVFMTLSIVLAIVVWCMGSPRMAISSIICTLLYIPPITDWVTKSTSRMVVSMAAVSATLYLIYTLW